MRSDGPQKEPAGGAPPAAMAVARLSPLRAGLEVGVILLLGLAVLFIYLFGKPFRRGFFCDDESIRHPVKPDTVSSLALALVGLGLPLLVIAATEQLEWGSRARGGVSLGRRRAPLPRWVSRASAASLSFLWGAGAQQLVVDSGKLLVGRLRPNFLAACLPDVDCAALQPPYDYVTNYTCLGGDADLIEDSRLSFPSGHSSLSFYAAVFTIVYIGRAGGPWCATLPRHLLQLMIFLAAWSTALSRVSDYKHHWSDVLAGVSVGSLIAVLTVVFVQPRRLRVSSGQPEGASGAASHDDAYGRVDGNVPPA